MRIGIVGAGMVATHMAKKIYDAGVDIVQLYNRTFSKAETLAKQVEAVPIENLHDFDSSLDLILLIVKDDVIKDIATKLNPNRNINFPVVAHSSGSKHSSKLESVGMDFGVFYPLQTFRNIEEKDWKEIPILYLGTTERARNVLSNLATKIGCAASEKTDDQRAAIHLSAVIVNNFVNHLYCLNKQFIESHKTDFQLLQPLIKKTMENSLGMDACATQTGPAKRGDDKVIEKHLYLLDEFPELQDLYKSFTQSIKKMYT